MHVGAGVGTEKEVRAGGTRPLSQRLTLEPWSSRYGGKVGRVRLDKKYVLFTVHFI